MKRKNSNLHGAAPDRSRMAVLILDMFSDYAFEDGPAVLRVAWPVARRIVRLKQRARGARIPVIYANDNLARRWRCDFPALVRHCSAPAMRGANIARILAPDDQDYCVLKPKHSAFFATALDTLLQYIGAQRLILTGVSAHQCVLFTANDAYVRDIELCIPRDCVASAGRAEMRLALQYFKAVLGADTRASSALRLRQR